VKRREFVFALAAAAWPLPAEAQQASVPTIGFLNSGSPDTEGDRVQAYRRGLSETGYTEGGSARLPTRYARA
jgi:putative ABC transport system substrate-binding protein